MTNLTHNLTLIATDRTPEPLVSSSRASIAVVICDPLYTFYRKTITVIVQTHLTV